MRAIKESLLFSSFYSYWSDRRTATVANNRCRDRTPSCNLFIEPPHQAAEGGDISRNEALVIGNIPDTPKTASLPLGKERNIVDRKTPLIDQGDFTGAEIDRDLHPIPLTDPVREECGILRMELIPYFNKESRAKICKVRPLMFSKEHDLPPLSFRKVSPHPVGYILPIS